MIKITLSQLLLRKRVLNNKISYCVCELLPFCAFSFVRYTQRDRFVRLVPVTIFYDRCRHDLQNKMAAPEASVHPLKIVFFTISPSAQRAKVVHRDVLEV